MFAQQLSDEEVRRRRRVRATPTERRAVQRVLQEHIAQVDQFTLAEARAMLPLLERAQRELTTQLRHWIATRPDGDVRFTAQSYRVALLEITRITDSLHRGLLSTLERSTTRVRGMAITHLTDEIARFSKIFGGTPMPVPLHVATTLATGRSFIIPRIRTSAARYAGNVGRDLQHTLAVSIIKGESISRIADVLQREGGPRGLVSLRGVAGEEDALVEYIPEGLFRRYRFWAQRVVRTETLSAYNARTLEGLHAFAHDVPGLLKRWGADVGACPVVCMLLDGQVKPLDVPFDSPLGDSIDHAPAHPNCRCRTGAWRADWPEILDSIG